ncbi:hypothetical protein HDF15_002779 [Granulicella mallensis]|uniref:Uncharacterized protein n=1 Tax=Granulicella mallensis TaxID=940614 RepID=A0A7W7ZQT1_9BACT|nr:hypothetical protein [Granulicella mallensis]
METLDSIVCSTEARHQYFAGDGCSYFIEGLSIALFFSFSRKKPNFLNIH